MICVWCGDECQPSPKRKYKIKLCSECYAASGLTGRKDRVVEYTPQAEALDLWIDNTFPPYETGERNRRVCDVVAANNYELSPASLSDRFGLSEPVVLDILHGAMIFDKVMAACKWRDAFDKQLDNVIQEHSISDGYGRGIRTYHDSQTGGSMSMGGAYKCRYARRFTTGGY